MYLESIYHKHGGREFGIELRKRSRTQLSPLTKKEIIRYPPKTTQQDVAEFFNNKYGFKIKRSTVGTILLIQDMLETATLIPNAKWIRQSANPQLDQVLNIWIMDHNSKNIC